MHDLSNNQYNPRRIQQKNEQTETITRNRFHRILQRVQFRILLVAL
jgi:hypothetical protein